MAQAVSISLSKFTESVQAAVKTAMAKHPKFKVEVPHAPTLSYLIRGIPVPEAILSTVTVGETQAFASDIAAHIARAHPEAFAAGSEGAVLSIGRHLIVGIPPLVQMVRLEK
jgi:hypothetical protein